MIVKIFESEGSFSTFRYKIELVWLVEDKQYRVHEFGVRGGKPYERLYTLTSSLAEAYADYQHYSRITESVLIEYWEGSA